MAETCFADTSVSSRRIFLMEKSEMLAGSAELARMISQTTWVEAAYSSCSL